MLQTNDTLKLFINRAKFKLLVISFKINFICSMQFILSLWYKYSKTGKCSINRVSYVYDLYKSKIQRL